MYVYCISSCQVWVVLLWLWSLQQFSSLQLKIFSSSSTASFAREHVQNNLMKRVILIKPGTNGKKWFNSRSTVAQSPSPGRIVKPFLFIYSQFHKSLPFSSVNFYWKTVRNYRTVCICISPILVRNSMREKYLFLLYFHILEVYFQKPSCGLKLPI